MSREEFLSRRKNIQTWYDDWFEEQMCYAYEELLYGANTKNQVISLSHAITKHCVSETELIHRIRNERKDIATAFDAEPKTVFNTIKQYLSDEKEYILDWLADQDDDQDYLIEMPLSGYGFRWNKETREVDTLPQLTRSKLVLEKINNKRNNVFYIPSVYPTDEEF